MSARAFRLAIAAMVGISLGAVAAGLLIAGGGAL